MQPTEDTADRVVWRCLDGPADWRDTGTTFQLEPAGEQETTLHFGHADWREPTEFMNHCSTHWASYPIGLKARQARPARS